MKILILASNPRNDLNLDDEVRLLKRVIERSRDRDQVEIVNESGVQVEDLQFLLLRHQPQIVHFSGHGSGEEGLIFKSQEGGERWVRSEALANLFGLNRISSHVQCVLLNACYSEAQANAIVNGIDYVVGMSHEIQDNAAIAFSKGFYLALGEGCSIEEAFEFGCNAIQLEITGSSKVRSAVPEPQRRLEVVDAVAKTIIPEHLKPILKKRSALVSFQTATPHQPLTQEKREEIQLEVDRALAEEETSLEQFREQVREYLQDHKLLDYEKDLLEALREDLGLTQAEANRVLEEEFEPIRQAREAYKRRLNALIKYYPFSDAIQGELKKFQLQRDLSDEEVNEISQPILEQAEVKHQAKLRQQAQQEYEAKLQRYEQEFRKAIDSQYPIEGEMRQRLKRFQQVLELKAQDVARIEETIVAPKEVAYQEKRRQSAYQQLVEQQYEQTRKQPEVEQATAPSDWFWLVAFILVAFLAGVMGFLLWSNLLDVSPQGDSPILTPPLESPQ
ncbi:hypothetical protein C7B61_20665 [filamentous cyanobacterium CCP1]|nr:hypothetical protein C7B61_20665 [filamentous cyanobacterium CCP1]